MSQGSTRGIPLDTDGTLANNSDQLVATQKATKTYIDARATGTNTGDQTSIVGITGTKAQFDTACTDGNFAYQSDLASYATTAAVAAGYQPLDTQLTDLAGLSYVGNGSKVVRVNAGATGFELATVSGTGDVVGPASSVASEIALFDGTTGKLLKSATTTGILKATAGVLSAAVASTDYAPATSGSAILKGNGSGGFSSAALGTDYGDASGPGSSTDNAIARFDGTGGKTLQNSAATVSDDGVIRSATNSAANAVSVPLCNWMMLTADYTLANSGAAQKAFNTTTNGALTLPTGVYHFEWWFYITTMSATSGSVSANPVGGGTAVTDRFGWSSVGLDSSTPLGAAAQGGSASVTAAGATNVVTGATGTGVQAKSSGMFRVSTGGTIIPSITLTTAVGTAVMKAGSYFKISKIGESSETYVGAWT